jgi:hypothetical protein
MRPYPNASLIEFIIEVIEAPFEPCAFNGDLEISKA